MSVVEGEVITAFNLRLKKPAGSDRPMNVTGIYRYEPKKEGGKARYRLGGKDADHGDGMSKFCNEEFAKLAAKELDLKIEKAVAKPSKKKKSCKKIGEDAEERCDDRRAASKKKASPKKKAPAKKAPAKKAPRKKAAPKKKSSRAKK